RVPSAVRAGGGLVRHGPRPGARRGISHSDAADHTRNTHRRGARAPFHLQAARHSRRRFRARPTLARPTSQLTVQIPSRPSAPRGHGGRAFTMIVAAPDTLPADALTVAL